MAGKEDDREGKDEEKPRDDEAEPAEDGTDRSAQPPRTEDRQLSRRWTRQKVGGSDAIFELPGIQPVPFVDTHATEQCDVGGRTAEPNATEAGPFTSDGGQRYVLGGCARDGVVIAHRGSSSRISRTSSRSCFLVAFNSHMILLM